MCLESAHGHCLGGFVVLLQAVALLRCIVASAPFLIGGELPVFIVRSHTPNRDAHTVTARYEYMYRSTPSIYIYICIYVCVCVCVCVCVYHNQVDFIQNLSLSEDKLYF